METITFEVDEDYLERLDIYLSKMVNNLSRNEIQNLIKEKLVLVNNKAEKQSYSVKKNDSIQINIPVKEELKLIKEDIDLNIIYEDHDIAIVNKPKGMVVHPSPGHETGTLANGLLYHLESLSDYNGDLRPGIVHRLDKDTSGILVVAKNNMAHEKLAEQFKARTVIRKYNTLVHGVVSNKKGIINAPIGRHPVDRKKMAVVDENGKEAISEYLILEKFDKYTFLEVELKTGRTHQIRVHMNYLNYPIVGDQVYSNGRNEFGLENQYLHARELSFIHPRTENIIRFEAELPEENKRILQGLINRRDSICL